MKSTLVLIGIGLCGGQTELQASGTYPPAPPQLRADITQAIDPTAYNLGKLIFAGKAKLSGERVPPALAQKNHDSLTAIVGRIPDRARQQINVDTLAPRLSSDESDALLYYLQLRFRLEEVTT